MTKEEEIELAWEIHTRPLKFGEVRRRWLLMRYTEQDGKCAYCRAEMTLPFDANNPLSATLDHVIPKFYGGPNSYNNFVAACHSCNRAKGHMLPAEFIFRKLLDLLDVRC